MNAGPVGLSALFSFLLEDVGVGSHVERQAEGVGRQGKQVTREWHSDNKGDCESGSSSHDSHTENRLGWAMTGVDAECIPEAVELAATHNVSATTAAPGFHDSNGSRDSFARSGGSRLRGSSIDDIAVL